MRKHLRRPPLSKPKIERESPLLFQSPRESQGPGRQARVHRIAPRMLRPKRRAHQRVHRPPPRLVHAHHRRIKGQKRLATPTRRRTRLAFRQTGQQGLVAKNMRVPQHPRPRRAFRICGAAIFDQTHAVPRLLPPGQIHARDQHRPGPSFARCMISAYSRASSGVSTAWILALRRGSPQIDSVSSGRPASQSSIVEGL